MQASHGNSQMRREFGLVPSIALNMSNDLAGTPGKGDFRRDFLGISHGAPWGTPQCYDHCTVRACFTTSAPTRWA